MSELIPLEKARNRLAVLWFVGGSIVIILFVVMSLGDRFEDKVSDAWGWLLPTIMPILGVISSVLRATALDVTQSGGLVRRGFFHLSQGLSLLYLVLVLVTILSATDGHKALVVLHRSNLWLGPLQGLVASTVGGLFVTRGRDGSG